MPPTRPRHRPVVLSIETTDLNCELVADALDAAAAIRRRAGIAASEELENERLASDPPRDTRTEAQRIVRTLAEASVLEKTAAAFRAALDGVDRREDPPAEPPAGASPSAAAPPLPADADPGPLAAWSGDPSAAAAAASADEARLEAEAAQRSPAEAERLALAEAELP